MEIKICIVHHFDENKTVNISVENLCPTLQKDKDKLINIIEKLFQEHKEMLTNENSISQLHPETPEYPQHKYE
ncbi:hypothetical protein [Elizabethkingia meningoseptica]|uniref:hypothetical protein n=1 Tax=Elizabethkingia meningoseptica TaxID=238 RepID=UPI00162622FC|nr:hypothetical protein [Elizabethkingia meningoseptica]MBG0515974.1 hypothetical protein [Elizabethkingia meningoseptica]